MHIKGHTETWCLENCNPKIFPELDDINTQVCEQTNFWYGLYSSEFKYMNQAHFNFATFILCNERNNIKIDQRLLHLDLCKVGHRSKAYKRKLYANDINNNHSGDSDDGADDEIDI